MERENRLSFFWTLIALVVMVFCFMSSAKAQVSPGFNSNSFQYLNAVLTSAQPTSTRVVNAFNSVSLPRFYSMAVTTAASGAFQVALEGSLDNSNWTTIATTTSALGLVSNINPFPLLYFRLRAASIVSGAEVTATAVGAW